MARIKVRNFGPIREGLPSGDGWLDLRKVTAFIGNQGSGKSTVAKLISTFQWMEKVLVRGDYQSRWLASRGRLQNTLLSYHRLETYFKSNGSGETDIHYIGDAYEIRFVNGELEIQKSSAENAYALPQIMYVPAERNFIAYVKNPNELKLSSGALLDFLTAYENAKEDLRNPVALPIHGTEVEYDRLNDVLNLRGIGYRVRLSDASSGFQSIVPLFLVSTHLAEQVRQQSESPKPVSQEELKRFQKGYEEIWANESLTDEQRRAAISVLTSRFNKTAFVNIVEEPEQNLFPKSQRSLLHSLLTLNNWNPANRLLLTTHSPYLINFLNIVVQAAQLDAKLIDAGRADLRTRLEGIVPNAALTGNDQVAIYEFDEVTGRIQQLSSEYGIPSDKNYLNQQLREGNILFDQLLELEEDLRP